MSKAETLLRFFGLCLSCKMERGKQILDRIINPGQAIYDGKDPFPNGSPYCPWPEPWQNYILAFFGSFIAIAVPAYVEFHTETNLLLTSMGASAVLFYANPNSPLTQPRNVFIGNLMSAFVGLCSRLILDSAAKVPQDWFWLSGASAVSVSILLMMITNNIYPPGGATALATAILPLMPGNGGASSFIWLVTPVLLGTMFQLSLAVIMNNVFVKTRHYPDRWWK